MSWRVSLFQDVSISQLKTEQNPEMSELFQLENCTNVKQNLLPKKEGCSASLCPDACECFVCQDNPGIMVRALNHLFTAMQEVSDSVHKVSDG